MRLKDALASVSTRSGPFSLGDGQGFETLLRIRDVDGPIAPITP
jgi:hypothetical protein